MFLPLLHVSACTYTHLTFTHTHTPLMHTHSLTHTHTHTHTPLQTVKLTSPDYKGSNPDDAVKDFEQRIKNYELVYEPLDKDKDM